MVWIPAGVWIGGALLAAVLLGYCVYELAWKTKRLRRDLAGLQQLSGELGALQQQVAATQDRLATTQQQLRAARSQRSGSR